MICGWLEPVNIRPQPTETTVITIVSDAFTWTPGDALWDVVVPQVSQRGEVNVAVKYQADVRKKQRVGV